jgi:hypothetical protein
MLINYFSSPLKINIACNENDRCYEKNCMIKFTTSERTNPWLGVSRRTVMTLASVRAHLFFKIRPDELAQAVELNFDRFRGENGKKARTEATVVTVWLK